MTEPRTVYLLGAGASRDAGLPVSMGLTQRIGKLIQAEEPFKPSPYGYDPPVGPLTQAYYAAIANIQAGDAYKGRPPGGVDIERLFTTIQMLATASDLEIAPFVQQWREPFPSRNDMSEWSWFIEEALRYSRSMREGRQEAFGNSGPPAPSVSETYRKLCKVVHEKLGSALIPESKTAHDYLTGLFRSKPIRIATLNYDIGVENASANAGLLVDTGVEKWKGGMSWEWDENADVRLLKLHGSIDWGRPYGVEECLPEDEPRMVRIQSREEWSVNRGLDDRSLQPLGLVFGLRGKLRPDGPFLAMLVEFWNWLLAAERLVVVGYSFRDEHINKLIEDWIGVRKGCVVEIVDPCVPETSFECDRTVPEFIHAALQYKNNEARGCAYFPSMWKGACPVFEFHRMKAAEWVESRS